MTRETKLGLVVAGSFLALVGGVVVARLKQADAPVEGTEMAAVTPPPTGESEAPPPPAAPEKLKNHVSSDAVANANGAKMPSPAPAAPPNPAPDPQPAASPSPQPAPVIEPQAPTPAPAPIPDPAPAPAPVIAPPEPVVAATEHAELAGPPAPDPMTTGPASTPAMPPSTPVVAAPMHEPTPTPAPVVPPMEPPAPVQAPKPEPTPAPILTSTPTTAPAPAPDPIQNPTPAPTPSPTPVAIAPIPQMPAPPQASAPVPEVKHEPLAPTAVAPIAPPPLNPEVAKNAVPTVAVIPASSGANTAAGLEAPRVPAAGPPHDQFTAAPKPAAPPQPTRDSYLEEQYRWNAGDSFETLSNKNYGTPKYAEALLKYNQDYPLASRELRQTPPAVAPGQVVWVPPVRILERDYASHIRDLTPIATPTSRPAVTPVVPPPGLANSGFGNPAGQLYRVRANGESVQEIARRTLGNPAQAARVQQLNPTLSPDPRLPIPAGTVLRLPNDALVDVGDRP